MARSTKAVNAYTLKTQLGRILRQVGDRERFVIFRRNLPVGVLLSVQDYVKEHPDEFENIADFVDTLVEEADPEFQASLKRGSQEIKRDRYLSHTQLKLALAGKKLR